MKLACIFGILFWCTLIINISGKSVIKKEQNLRTDAKEDYFNSFIQKSHEAVGSELLLRGKKKKGMGPSRNCYDVMKQGKKSGVYTINPCDDKPFKTVDVYCDMDTDDGGWTVIQRRDNFPEQQNFQKTWLEYLMGFGDVAKDFWLGNENIHCLTRQTSNELRVELNDWKDEFKFAKYGFFYVYDEVTKFKLTIRDYSGSAGDALAWSNGRYFSTFDADNDPWSGNCAVTYTGAWWYNTCHHSNLNGLYNNTEFGKGTNWKPWYGHHYSFKKNEMKIRPQKQ